MAKDSRAANGRRGATSFKDRNSDNGVESHDDPERQTKLTSKRSSFGVFEPGVRSRVRIPTTLMRLPRNPTAQSRSGASSRTCPAVTKNLVSSSEEDASSNGFRSASPVQSIHRDSNGQRSGRKAASVFGEFRCRLAVKCGTRSLRYCHRVPAPN
jgi:hypothetical protein